MVSVRDDSSLGSSRRATSPATRGEDKAPGAGSPAPAGAPTRGRRVWSMLALLAGAAVFLFPFYYMIVGSLQAKPDTSIKGAIPTGGLTLHNYADINSRVNLVQSLLNSGIFTGGVLLMTMVFGMLAPFAIISAAVFVFRQFFLQLPDDLFAAAALDGASELRILWSIALPLVRPAMLTVLLITFIGPWNEFLWPFLVTKDQSLQPLAVTLANYISNIAGRATNPAGAVLAGAVVLAAPAVGLFIAFQKHFTGSELSSGVKG